MVKKVNMINLKTETFEGPLDLLLALISRQKMNIFDIPISEITSQYLAYLDQMRELDLEIASEFLVMASELMLIKSKLLLPKKEGDEDPRKPLVDALTEHRRAVLAAEFLKLQSEMYFDSFTKPPDPTDATYTKKHPSELLADAFFELLARSADKSSLKHERLFKKISSETFYSVEKKLSEIIAILAVHKRCAFEELFFGIDARSEKIAAFLAILEALRLGYIDAHREESRVYITYIPPEQQNIQELQETQETQEENGTTTEAKGGENDGTYDRDN